MATCSHKHQDKRKHKTQMSITPAVTTVIGKCLGLHSDSLSALRTYYSLILSHSGLTDAGMNRLAKLYDCVTHQSILQKLNGIATRYDMEMKTWEQYNIVLDNVDIYIKPRRETASVSNKMFHMVQAIAVKDRVLTQKNDKSRQPLVNVDELLPHHAYPTDNDHKELQTLLRHKLEFIITQMPGLGHLAGKTQTKKHHKYSDEMKKKSEQVSVK